jgi:hypothetical protein
MEKSLLFTVCGVLVAFGTFTIAGSAGFFMQLLGAIVTALGGSAAYLMLSHRSPEAPRKREASSAATSWRDASRDRRRRFILAFPMTRGCRNRWADDVRLTDLEPTSPVMSAGERRADVRPFSSIIWGRLGRIGPY